MNPFYAHIRPEFLSYWRSTKLLCGSPSDEPTSSPVGGSLKELRPFLTLVTLSVAAFIYQPTNIYPMAPKNHIPPHTMSDNSPL